MDFLELRVARENEALSVLRETKACPVHLAFKAKRATKVSPDLTV